MNSKFVLLVCITLIYLPGPLIYAHIATITGSPWAGWTIYNDYGNPNLYSVNNITGSWIVENVITTNATTYGAQWIGIGGEHDKALIQIGTTSNYCVGLVNFPYCKNATNAFWEIVANNSWPPSPPIPIRRSIKPGDKIKASITLINGSSYPASLYCYNHSPCWRLYLNDTSGGELPFINYTYFPTNTASADWIQESLQGFGGRVEPIAKFRAAYFGPHYTHIKNTNIADINLTSGPIGNYSYLTAYYMSSPNMGAINTSSLGSDNASFIVYEGPQFEMVGGLNVSRSMIDLGQEAAINGPHATGGSGNYTYNWIEQLAVPQSIIFQNSSDGCISGQGTTKLVFNTALGCNAVQGLYRFRLAATDIETGQSVYSSYITVYVISLPVLNQLTENGAIAYVPLSIYNNQSSAISNGTQFAIAFNALKYKSMEGIYLNPNLSNICVANNGTCITAWIQGNLTQGVNAYAPICNPNPYPCLYPIKKYFSYWLSNYTDLIWIRSPASIGPHSSYNSLSVLVFPKTDNEYSNPAILGANPAINCSIYCPSKYYAGADNGGRIFDFYDNFVGNYSMPVPDTNATDTGIVDSNFSYYSLVTGSTGHVQTAGSWTVSNGLSVAYTGGDQAAFCPSFPYNYYCYGMFVYTNRNFSTGSNLTIDSGVVRGNPPWGDNNGNGALGFYEINANSTVNSIGYGSVNDIDGGQDQLVFDNVGWVNSSWWNTPVGSGMLNLYSISMFLSNGKMYFGRAYGNGVFYNFTTNSNNADSFAFSPEDTDIGENYNPFVTDYFLARKTLPGNQNPVTSSSALYRTQTNLNYQGKVLTGKPYTISVSALIPGTNLTMTIGDPIVTVNGIGSINYTICSIPANCLSPGTYYITVNDLVTGYNQTWPLDIIPPPNATVSPTNSILDQGQQIYLDAVTTNGSGIFTYQWYNASSGGNVPIAGQSNGLFLFNATNTGTFKYYVTVNDVGVNNAVTVRSNSVLLTVNPAVSVNVTPTNYILNGSKQLTFNAIVTGGTGNFVYQWYNFSSGIFPVVMSNQTSNTLTLPFDSHGNFSYLAIVTDQGTTTSPKASDISVPSSITFVQPSTCGTVPSTMNLTACLSINITNNQNGPILSNTQIAIPFPANSYETYEAANMMNVFIYNISSGNTAPCWLEGNTLNEVQSQNLYASANLLYWCKIPDSIPVQSTDTNWYFGFANSSTDLYGNSIAQLGVAPQLYCGSPYNCPASSYAGADNGNIVFSFYDNFSGTTLRSKWAGSTNPSYCIYTVSNGLEITDSHSNGGNIFCQTYSLPSFTLPIISEGLLEGITSSTYTSIGANMTATSQTNTNSYLMWFNPYHGCEIMSSDGEILGDVSGISSTCNEDVWSIYSLFASPNSITATLNYGLSASQNTSSVPVPSPTNIITSVGEYPGTAVSKYQWVRARVPPPNNVQPKVSYSSLKVANSHVFLLFSSNPANAGSSVNVTATCVPNTDTCAVQSPLGTTLCSGTGSCVYQTSALPAGNYTYFANDLTLNHSVKEILQMVAYCGNTPSGFGIDTCIPIKIDNTQASSILPNTQIAIPFPANSYETYEASNMMNVFIYNASDGNTAPCWLEGNTLNETQSQNLYTSANILYWCRIPNSIPALSTDSNWYFGLAPSSTDLYGNSIAQLGAAPQLYCGSPHNCPASSYAGADNGNAVFNFYDNFSGTVLGSKWYARAGTATVNNSVTFTMGSQDSWLASAIPINGLTNDTDFLGSIAGTTSGYDAQWVCYSEGGAATDGCTSYGFKIGSSSGAGSDLLSCSGSLCETYGTISSVTTPTAISLFSIWSAGGMAYVSDNYGIISSVNNSQYLTSNIDFGGSSTFTSGMKYFIYYVRSRTQPPNNVQPSISYGTSGSLNGTKAAVAGGSAPYLGNAYTVPGQSTQLTSSNSLSGGGILISSTSTNGSGSTSTVTTVAPSNSVVTAQKSNHNHSK